jgi:molybdate transport system permease protein
MEPLYVSLKTAMVATVITFFLGIYIAYVVSRMKRGKIIVDALLTLPLVLPPTVIGFFLLSMFGNQGTFGKFLNQFGISIVFTWWGAVIAAIFVAFPLMYRTTKSAFEQFDKNILYAARTLGLSEFTIFHKIVLPNCMPVILAGTILAFSRTLGEFGATIMIAGNIPGKTQTISIAIYQAVQAGNRQLAYQWVVVILCISFLCILAMNYVLHRYGSRRVSK